MPKFTKPYWVDWQGESKSEDGWAATNEPETTRRRVTLPRTVVQDPADSERATARGVPQQTGADAAPRRIVGAGAPSPAPAVTRSKISDLGPPTRTIVEESAPNRADPDGRPTVIDTAPPAMEEHQAVIDVPTADFVPDTSVMTQEEVMRAHAAATGTVPAPAATDGSRPNPRVDVVQARDDTSNLAGAKPANALVVHSRPTGQAASGGRADPPHIVVARHELTAELSGDPRLVIVRDPDSEMAAAYRVLRHQLVQNGNPQVVVVTSALPGEGKTTCALNLALALGECNRARVLLVEANFRRPRLGGVFRFEPPWCFAQQIAEHRNNPLERWSVVEIAPHGLHVVAVDPRTEQRALLDAPAFALAIERLRLAGYDYIVIDAPPVLGSAEVNLIQDAADGVLLTTRSGKSRGRNLKKAVEQISPGTIFGVALLHF